MDSLQKNKLNSIQIVLGSKQLASQSVVNLKIPRSFY